MHHATSLPSHTHGASTHLWQRAISLIALHPVRFNVFCPFHRCINGFNAFNFRTSNWHNPYNTYSWVGIYSSIRNMASYSRSLDNPISPSRKKGDTLLISQINIYYHPNDNATPCQKPESQKRSAQWQVDRQSRGIWTETPEYNVWSINSNDRAFKSTFVSNIVIMGDFICGEMSCSFYRDIDIFMIVPAYLLRKFIFSLFISFISLGFFNFSL